MRSAAFSYGSRVKVRSAGRLNSMVSLAILTAFAARPNIVFILADDLGYGDLGCYGQKVIQTPNLDKMAAMGLRFTHHYSGSTVCAPARDTFMTGRDTGHSWMRGNGSSALRRDPFDITIATLLKREGYRTGMIGKSSVQCELEDPKLPNDKGFDHFFGFLGHTPAHHHYPEKLWTDGQPVLYPDNHGWTGKQYAPDLFAADIKNFLAKKDKRPFFLMYAATLPHAGLIVPDEWKKPYQGRFKETPSAEGFYNACAEPIATYAGMVSKLDHDCGAILDQLKVEGLEKNTLVLFASDNGGTIEGGYNAADLNSNGGLRGIKRDLYEGAVRVPLIAYWPGTIAAGRTSDHICTLYDFFPTACDLAGLKKPLTIQGISYAPTLLNRGEQGNHPYLYWEFHEEGGKRAVRVGRWKMVQLNVHKDPEGPVEVYDEDVDPQETTNMARLHPELVSQARELFRTGRTPNPNFNFAGNPMLCCEG